MDGPEVINFASVESALNAALESDERYQRENDAKFRAVHQKVASYEEFRDIVLASHLKPLEKSDVAGSPRKQPWNSVFSATKQKDTVFCEVTEFLLGRRVSHRYDLDILDIEKHPYLLTKGGNFTQIEDRWDTKARHQHYPPSPRTILMWSVKSDAATFQPRTASEFQRGWRRLGGKVKDKYHCILSLSGPKLKDIFNIEIASGLLGEFLIIMAQCMQPGDEVDVLAILQGLSQTCRFSLNVSFLDQAEREGCSQLFGRLLDVTDKQAEIGHTDVGHDGAHKHTTEIQGKEKNYKAFCDAQTAGERIDVEKLKDLMQCYDVKTQAFATRLDCITQDS